MSRLKIALIGVGDVALRDYLPEFHRIAERAEIVAMCGRTPERVQHVAAQYEAQAYTDYQQMLAETTATVVVNLTPVQLHYATNLAALRAGKHLYSEKTVALQTAEARQLRDTAHERGLCLVCAPCVLLWPQFLRARALVGEGRLGEVYAAHASLPGSLPPWRGYMSDPSHFFAAGGGPLRDMGVYALHALTGLLGPVERVSAFSSRVLDRFVPDDGPASGKTIPVEVDLNWQLILDHGGGRLASLTVNFCSVGAARAPQLELLGTQGALAVNLLDVAAPLELFSVATSAWEVIALPISGRAGGPDHIMGVEHLLDSVASGDAPILSIEHALHVLDVIECAERSARDGRAVEVSGTVGSARFAALA